MKLFGEQAVYVDDRLDSEIEETIAATYEFRELPIRKLLGTNKPVFACSELSMLASHQNIKGYDTLQVTIEKIVREL